MNKVAAEHETKNILRLIILKVINNRNVKYKSKNLKKAHDLIKVVLSFRFSKLYLYIVLKVLTKIR